MTVRIESIQNARLRKVSALHQPGKARDAGVFCLEGLRSVQELCAPWRAQSLWLSDSFSARNPEAVQKLTREEPDVWSGTEIYSVPDPLFRRIADTVHPQGILAVVCRHAYTAWDLIREPFLWVVLENLQDPGNAGTVIRTADACAASGILCTKGTVDFYNEKTVRSAMGSLFHIPFLTVESVEEAAEFVREQRGQFIGTHLKAETSYFDLSYRIPTAFLIGNEGSGISVEAVKACTHLVKIPMPGRAESLNASVAASVMLYETMRQRRLQPGL